MRLRLSAHTFFTLFVVVVAVAYNPYPYLVSSLLLFLLYILHLLLFPPSLLLVLWLSFFFLHLRLPPPLPLFTPAVALLLAGWRVRMLRGPQEVVGAAALLELLQQHRRLRLGFIM